MDYHIFNIGAPYINEWWSELLQRGVITAGYTGDPGDRGDVILHDMTEGDWLIAYCNQRGYVGASFQTSTVTSYTMRMCLGLFRIIVMNEAFHGSIP